MALEITPGSVIKAGTAYGAQKGADWVEQQTGVRPPTSVKGVARAGMKLGVSEAEKLKREELAKLGLPDIPLKIPELTPEGVKDAAYAGAKPYLENAIQAETGVPIKLPKKLTLKDLEKTVGSIFPDDVGEALDLALSVGAQLAASALSSVLAGTAIGSVIPGLGTIVGLAVGLAVAGVKSLFTKVPTHSEGRECWTGKKPPTPSSDPFTMAKRIEAAKRVKVPCPTPPTNANAFQLFTWATRSMQPLWNGLVQEQRTHACGRGDAINCVRGLNQMRDIAFWMALPTVQDLGLPAVAAVANGLSGVPEIEGGINFVVGYRGTQPLSDAIVHRNQGLTSPSELAELLRRRALGSAAITRSTPFLPGESSGSLGRRPLELGDYVSSGLLLQALRWRKEYLERLLQSAQAGTASRFDLVTELSKAAVQIQNNPSSDAVLWFKTVWGFVDRMEKAEAARLAAMRATQARRTQIGRTRIQADPRAAEVSTLRSGCQIGDQRSCERLRQMGVLPSTQRPAPAPTRPPPVQIPMQPTPKPGPDAATVLCWNLYQGWAAKNPRQASCLTQMDKDWILKFCYDAHGLKRFTIPESLQRIQMVISMACKKKGIAA